jgi:hypothetical protein
VLHPKNAACGEPRHDGRHIRGSLEDVF